MTSYLPSVEKVYLPAKYLSRIWPNQARSQDFWKGGANQKNFQEKRIMYEYGVLRNAGAKHPIEGKAEAKIIETLIKLMLDFTVAISIKFMQDYCSGIRKQSTKIIA
jgi:hypothetical protein